MKKQLIVILERFLGVGCLLIFQLLIAKKLGPDNWVSIAIPLGYFASIWQLIKLSLDEEILNNNINNNVVGKRLIIYGFLVYGLTQLLHLDEYVVLLAIVPVTESFRAYTWKLKNVLKYILVEIGLIIFSIYLLLALTSNLFQIVILRFSVSLITLFLIVYFSRKKEQKSWSKERRYTEYLGVKFDSVIGSISSFIIYRYFSLPQIIGMALLLQGYKLGNIIVKNVLKSYYVEIAYNDNKRYYHFVILTILLFSIVGVSLLELFFGEEWAGLTRYYLMLIPFLWLCALNKVSFARFKRIGEYRIGALVTSLTLIGGLCAFLTGMNVLNFVCVISLIELIKYLILRVFEKSCSNNS